MLLTAGRPIAGNLLAPGIAHCGTSFMRKALGMFWIASGVLLVAFVVSSVGFDVT